jgi:hypothetical protein
VGRAGEAAQMRFRGQGLGLNFVPMDASAGPLFSFTGISKPDPFVFDSFFTNLTATQNLTDPIFNLILFLCGSGFWFLT